MFEMNHVILSAISYAASIYTNFVLFNTSLLSVQSSFLLNTHSSVEKLFYLFLYSRPHKWHQYQNVFRKI